MTTPQQYASMIDEEDKTNRKFMKRFKVSEVKDMTKNEGLFGEIFITSNETNGGLEMLGYFKGKLISSLGGGHKKLFVIESNQENQGVLSSLHAPEYDDFDYTFSERDELIGKVENPQQIVAGFSNKGNIKLILSGKKHMLFLTEEGQIYSWGNGEYGSLGLGGVVFSYIPRQLKNMDGKKVNQIACGEYHSLLLTDQHDIYVWGKGFTGQLGIKGIQTLSSPKYLPFFNKPPYDEYSISKLKKDEKIKYKNYIMSIAAGAYHSLAINYQGKLYGWGEASMGQIGNGKKQMEEVPVIIRFDRQKKIQKFKSKINLGPNLQQLQNKHQEQEQEQEQEQNIVSDDHNISEQDDDDDDDSIRIVSCDGGYGHSAAISYKGQIFTWGFNMYGQLGLGDTKTRYYPSLLTMDILSNNLPNMSKISCGYFNTFGIDEKGKLYSWGGGNLGQKDEDSQKAPRRIEAHTEGRIFTDVYSNCHSTLFFAKARIISIRPDSGPSSGNTMLSLIGTGFCNTGKQKVRFTFTAKKMNNFKNRFSKTQSKYLEKEEIKSISVEVHCDFDPVTDCYHCFTPSFDDQNDDLLEWPVFCKVELTLDGFTYIPTDQQFLIYSSKLQTQNINPKCGSVQGGTTLTLLIPNMDEVTASRLQNLTIGFQAKNSQKKKNIRDNSLIDGVSQQMDISQLSNSNRYDSNGTQTDNKTRPQSNQHDRKNKGTINPLAIQPEDQELDKENWVCVVGNYQNGKITCVVPKISDMNSDSLQFNVDVAFNGQQFTGQPNSFRFYDIKVDNIEPNNGAYGGGLNIIINGQGFFDTINKQIMFKSVLGERIIDIEWDKKQRKYNFIQPPLNWLLGGLEPTQTNVQQLLDNNVTVFVSLNAIEWIKISNFYYLEPSIDRIGIADDKVTVEQFEQEEEDEVKKLQTMPDGTEKQKYIDELNKKKDNDILECQSYFKRAGQRLYIYGSSFQNVSTLSCRFQYNTQIVDQKAFFKNEHKVGVVIPELEDSQTGIYDVKLELSLNGTQFSNTKNTFRMVIYDKNMTADQKNKYEDTEMKALKKGAGKK